MRLVKGIAPTNGSFPAGLDYLITPPVSTGGVPGARERFIVGDAPLESLHLPSRHRLYIGPLAELGSG